MTVFLLALAGIPPTVGFISKFVIFSAAIDADMAWLAIIAIINSALSLYYYVRVVKYMYTVEPPKHRAKRVKIPAVYVFVIAVTLFFVFLIGVWPQPFIDFCTMAAQAFF
jgi:NADH-quinone oxidoreductase subunit N